MWFQVSGRGATLKVHTLSHTEDVKPTVLEQLNASTGSIASVIVAVIAFLSSAVAWWPCKGV